ncbi:hypothetical protein [Singulisphaera sp. GP187]|uniref:hypothetical protein n=1 Tax=Singulisphaera sp. GP187 TaxID=1882752 RepID=UPI0011610D92|nr:hypothetical protein [Singulisphaera sp. GP187]
MVSPPLQASLTPTGLRLACMIPATTRIAKASSSGIPARVGSTLGKATDVVLYDLAEGVLASETVTETAYNMSTTAIGANSYVMLNRVGNYWIVAFEDCPA